MQTVLIMSFTMQLTNRCIKTGGKGRPKSEEADGSENFTNQLHC